MKRALVFLLLAIACDHGSDTIVDGAPAMSAIIPPFNPSSLPSVMPSTEIAPPPIASSDAAIACGKKPLPDCPLQAWMKKNMTPAMEAKDWQGIAFSLESAAQLVPSQPGYTNWISIAKDGANAARAAELDAVKAACRGCHDQYKTKYRTELRTRPIP